MQPLPPFNPENFKSTAPIRSTIGQMAAGHWAQQLVKLFPSTSATSLTPDFLAAIASIFMEYPERVVAIVCNPAHGIASTEEFFPSIAKLKAYCSRAATDVAERDKMEKLSQRQSKPNAPSEPLKPSYKGPIEEVRPGDILDHDRIEEYRAFMASRHGMRNAKLWGPNEHYVDSKLRPFAKAKPAKPAPEKEINSASPNPFE